MKISRPRFIRSMPLLARLATRKEPTRLVCEHRVEVVVGHPQQQRVPGDPGVGDQHLHRALVLLHRGEGRVEGVGVGDVGPYGEHALRVAPRSGR